MFVATRTHLGLDLAWKSDCTDVCAWLMPMKVTKCLKNKEWWILVQKCISQKYWKIYFIRVFSYFFAFPICSIRRYDCGAVQYDCNTDCWLLRQAANPKKKFKETLKRSCAQLCASCFYQFLRDSGQSCAGLVTAMSLPHAEAASTYEILRDGLWLDDQKLEGGPEQTVVRREIRSY